MNFSEALKALKDGKKIRSTRDYYRYRMHNGVVYYDDNDNEGSAWLKASCLNWESILDEWEVLDDKK